MRKHLCIPLSFLALFSSCLDEDDEDTVDLEAPIISANAGGNIQPEYFYNTSTDNGQIPVAFVVQDATGIQEVLMEAHSAFDGHTHGKSISARNPKFKLFNHNHVIRAESMDDPTRFAYSSNIYLDERNPDIEEDELLLAGPYHFSIQATDVEGNQTTYGDDTIYHTTVYINKPYAPQAEITNLNSAESTIAGRIYRNMDHVASSDINFLWIYVQEPNTAHSDQEGDILEERLWGQSNWPHQFRPNQGDALPNAQELDMAQLFANDQDFFGVLQGNKLVVWAEDTNGNISVTQFNN